MCPSFANFEEFGRCLNNQSNCPKARSWCLLCGKTDLSRSRSVSSYCMFAKSLEKKETLTKEILKLELWDSKQLATKKMKRLKTKTEKQNALKSQINFRHFVLEQKAEKFKFQLWVYI
jgi:hypothetical protein